MVQLSHQYMITGKIIALTIHILVSKKFEIPKHILLESDQPPLTLQVPRKTRARAGLALRGGVLVYSVLNHQSRLSNISPSVRKKISKSSN